MSQSVKVRRSSRTHSQGEEPPHINLPTYQPTYLPNCTNDSPNDHDGHLTTQNHCQHRSNVIPTTTVSTNLDHSLHSFVRSQAVSCRLAIHPSTANSRRAHGCAHNNNQPTNQKTTNTTNTEDETLVVDRVSSIATCTCMYVITKQ